MADTVHIRRVLDDNEIDAVADLAGVIWSDHYAPIIGLGQVNYMLDNLHSRSVIKDEILGGEFEYYLISSDGRECGYLSVRIEEKALFLSKIYVLSSVRGQGIGKQAMAFVRDRASSAGLERIRLTVNKKNTGSISAYEKLGFRKSGEVKMDIGGGYFMDDYAMEWTL